MDVQYLEAVVGCDCVKTEIDSFIYRHELWALFCLAPFGAQF